MELDPALATQEPQEGEELLGTPYDEEPELAEGEGGDDPELDVDTDWGDNQRTTITFMFIAPRDMETPEVWKKAHELIQSAEAKGLKLYEGAVTDHGAADD
jgi:hypothetical protein